MIMLFLGTSFFASDIDLWKSSTLNKILQRGELRIGLDPGYMPFEMKDKNGRLIGYDIDMAKKMAKDMGVKLKIVPTDWDGIIAGLLTDKFDIIMSGMTITQQRNLKISFSKPHIILGQTLLLNKSLEGKILSANDLDKKGYKIVTKLGVTGEIAARKFFKKAEIQTFERITDAINEVLNGKADAVIYDKPYNGIFLANKGKGQLIHLDTPLTYEPLGWAIKKGDADFMNWLNNFLRQIQEDKVVGFSDKIYKKWFIETKWLNKVQ